MTGGVNVVAVGRAVRFSPNSVAKDEAILRAVAELTGACLLNEESLLADDLRGADVVLSMVRGKRALALLSRCEADGALVVNSPEGVARCRRSSVEALMEREGIPVPPHEGSDGYWLKRGDEAAQGPGDVVFCPDRAELARAVERFRCRGIGDMTVRAHVVGDLVKFYGVLAPSGAAEDEGMFRVFYPGDDGMSKFGDEARNGTPIHYAFSLGSLRADAERTARLTGVAVYGGDAIVRPDGSYCIIDFNDWPSFARCRTEAARAIARLVRGGKD